MITDIRSASAEDLSVDNEVMNFRRAPLPESNTLAGASWSTLVISSSPYEALLSVFRFVYSLIEKKLPDYEIWLLIGDSLWQRDTRIVRYYKLWGGLKARGIEILHASHAQVVMLEAEGKLKFFGATQLSELSAGSAVKVLLEEHCTYLVALPRHLEPQDILGIGWSGRFAEDSSVIAYISKSGGLLLKRIGEFDDEDIGLAAIGQPELVKALLAV